MTGIRSLLPPSDTASTASTASTAPSPPQAIGPNTPTLSAAQLASAFNLDQETIKSLLENFDPNSKYILVFDIDGTLRENDSRPYSDGKAIDPEIAHILSELNSFPNIKIVTLSSRTAYTIIKSNIPKDIDRLCSNGTQHLYPFNMEEDKHPISYHLTHPGLALQTLLYSIIHRSREHKTTKSQNGNNKSFTKKLFKLLTKGIMEIADEKLNDKSPGIKQIVQRSLKKNKKPDHMFFFGNSNSDIKGMRVLQELAQKHKYKASTVFVKDPNDSDDPAISHRLSSFKATHDFLRALRNKLPEKIRDNEKTADYTVVSHNIQGNAISLPEHYTDLHYDRLINATRDRLHHNRIHTFQEFNGNDLAKLIEEEPSMNGGYKHINGLHVFWAPDFKQGTPNTLVDFYSDESSGFMHPRDRPREGMQYMVTIAPSKYFTLEADDTELNKNETRSEISPWFRIFKNNPKDSTKNNLIHTMTGWGKQVSPALAIRLRDAKNQAIQIVNFHLPAVMDTTRRINLFKNILRSTALAVGDLATIIAGDFNPLDDMLAFREFCTTRDSARSEEAKLEQVLHDKGFISPFRTKSPTHLDKRTFLKPFVKNLYRALDLIAINKNFKFHDIDEEKVAQKTEQYRCEPRSERKRLRKNLQYPSGVSVGKWHGSDHRKVTALIDKNSDTVTNTEPTETKTYVQRLNADPAKHHILAA